MKFCTNSQAIFRPEWFQSTTVWWCQIEKNLKFVIRPLVYHWILRLNIRWVSVVEFHDWVLGIGKVFGQESTVVEWNYQILGLHQVTVHQKLGVILVIKWFKNWSQQKMLFTKKVHLNWYSSMKFFLKDSDDFWHRKVTLKVQNWHFLKNCHQMERPWCWVAAYVTAG